MGVFGGNHRRRRGAERGYDANGSDDEASNAWSDLGQYAGDQHVSWDDLSKEKDFEERSITEAIDSSQNILPRSADTERVSDFSSQIGNFVDPYQPESGIEAFNFAKRQRKIIAAFESEAGADAMNASDVAENPYWRGQFLQEVADGTIDEVAEKNFLLVIPSDMEKRPKNETLSRIVEDFEAQQAFWNLSGGHMNEEGLRKLSEPNPGVKDYRTPLDFAEFQAAYLKRFDKDDQNYKKAKDGVNNLKKILYGEEQIGYYEAFESLKQRAYYDQYRENLEDQKSDFAGMGDQSVTLGGEATTYTSDQSQDAVTNENLRDEKDAFRIMSKVESEQLMKQAVVDGDPWKQNGVEYKLTPELLGQLDLGPKFEVEMNGARVCLSETYRLADNRNAAVGYVVTEQGVKVRSYYLDDKKGAWKYLPDYYMKDLESSRYVDEFELGQGYDEASVTLPAKLQKSLYEISSVGSKSISQKTNPAFVFAGTAQRYSSQFEYANSYFSNQMRGDYYREVSKEASFADLDNEAKPKPEQITIEGGSVPDFAKEVLRYEGRDAVMGKFEAESFRSLDDELTWTFYSKDNKICVGYVDVESKTTSTGCNQEWASLGKLGTRIYEEYYPGLLDEHESFRSKVDYNDRVKLADGEYIGMWQNYLRKIPVIREYLYQRLKRQ